MSKTLKAILDAVNNEIGFDLASQYVGSLDPNIRTLVQTANRSAQLLRDLHLQKLTRQAVLDISDAIVDLTMDPEGRISYLPFPTDFYDYVSDTSYQDGRIDPAQWPTPAATWAYLISRSGPQSLRVRLREMKDRLYVFSPDATQTLNFEYVSKYPINNIIAAPGSTGRNTEAPGETFVSDQDQWLLDSSLIELDIIWRYKRAKALDWQDDYQASERYQNLLRARDGGATTIYPPNAWPYPAEPYTNLWVQN